MCVVLLFVSVCVVVVVVIVVVFVVGILIVGYMPHIHDLKRGLSACLHVCECMCVWCPRPPGSTLASLCIRVLRGPRPSRCFAYNKGTHQCVRCLCAGGICWGDVCATVFAVQWWMGG